MAFLRCWTFRLVGISVLLSWFAPLTNAQSGLELLVGAGNIQLRARDTMGFVPIFVSNPNDSIEAFELQVTASDSTIRFLPWVDTVGTLVSGWRFFLIDTFPGSIHILALTDQIGQNQVPAIGPSSTVRTLLRLPFRVINPDPLSAQVYDIVIDTNLADFGFSNPWGYLIGTVTDTLQTTVCLKCTEYSGENCVHWEIAAEPPCDSIFVDSTVVTVIDTAATRIILGSVVLNECCENRRGNFNYDSADMVNSLDLAWMIAYLVNHGQPPPCGPEGDVNGSGLINSLDLAWLISYLVRGTPLAPCP